MKFELFVGILVVLVFLVLGLFLPGGRHSVAEPVEIDDMELEWKFMENSGGPMISVGEGGCVFLCPEEVMRCKGCRKVKLK